MWLLPLGGREGHHSGQALIRQVQGGGPVRTLGTMEQDRIVFLTIMLGLRNQPQGDSGVPPAILSITGINKS